MEKFGFTNGCPGCIHKQLDLEDHRPHSLKCRRRFYELMKNDEDEVDRLLSNERRMGRQQPKEERIERPSAPQLEKDSSAVGPGTPRIAADDPVEEDVPELNLDEDDIPYHLPESEDEDEAEDAGREESRRKRSDEADETEIE